jgi:hypothetical protein
MSMARTNESQVPIVLRVGLALCIVIAVAVVIRRLVAIIHPTQSAPPQMAALDQAFASHAALTLAHILPALGFVLLVPFVLLRRFSHLAWPRAVLFPLGAVVGCTAYAMSTYSVGGWTERSAVFFYNTLFLFSLWKAWRHRQHSQSLPMKRWLTRAVVVLLGIATTRPVMAIFFATSSRTHLDANQFFGIAFWIGFTINWIVVELWLHHSRTAGSSGRQCA